MLLSVTTSEPGVRGLGAGFDSTTLPCTTDPAGITTCPWAFFTSATTDPVNSAPARVERVDRVSLIATSTNVPAAAVRVAGAGGVVDVDGFFAGGCDLGGAAEVDGVDGGGLAGTSRIAPDDSVGARVRLRAVESAGCCAVLSPFAQAATASVATAVIHIARFIGPPELWVSDLLAFRSQ